MMPSWVCCADPCIGWAGPFAAKAAPTGIVHASGYAQLLWEWVHLGQVPAGKVWLIELFREWCVT